MPAMAPAAKLAMNGSAAVGAVSYDSKGPREGQRGGGARFLWESDMAGETSQGREKKKSKK